jgi:hypothetical protein
LKMTFEKRDAHQYNGNVLIPLRKAQNQIEEASLYEAYTKRENFANKNLNREIGLEQALGSASPSHGPHAVSSRFLAQVPLVELAIPPVSLALAAKGGLKVCVGTTIPHKALGSPAKDASHSEKIAATIIGDCLEAICVYRDKLRSRSSGTVDYDGYHSQRRLDLLNKYLNQVEHP